MAYLTDGNWRHALPVIRVMEKRQSFTFGRRTVVALYEDALVIGKRRWFKRLPDEAYATDGREALKEVLRRRGREIPFVEIERLTVKPIRRLSGHPLCGFRIAAKSGHTRARVECPVDSVLIECAERMLDTRFSMQKRGLGISWIFGLLMMVLLVINFVALDIALIMNEPVGFLGVLPVQVFLGSALGYALFRRTPTVQRRRRRAARPRARRLVRRSLPWGWVTRIVGVLLIVAAYFCTNALVQQVIRSSGPTSELEAAIIGGYIGFTAGSIVLVFAALPGTTLLYLGYMLGQPDAARRMKSDGRAPVVFLRSFGDDGRRTFTQPGAVPAMLGVAVPPLFDALPPPFRYLFSVYPMRLVRLALGNGIDTGEEQLARAFRGVGPLVAIGKPNERLATPGAARMYVDDGSWQEVALGLIRSARLLIVQPAATEGVWWEVETAARELGHGGADRTVFSLWAVQEPDDLDITRARLGAVWPVALPAVRPGHAFLWFDARGAAHAEKLRIINPLLWPWRGTSADLQRTLAPVMEKLTEQPVPRAAYRSAASWRYRGLGVVSVALYFALFAVLGFAFHMGLRKLTSPSAGLRGSYVEYAVRNFSVPLDAGWRQTEKIDQVGLSSRVFRLRDELVLNVAITRSDSAGPMLHDASLRPIIDKLEEAGWDDAHVVGRDEQLIGGQPWEHAVIEWETLIDRFRLEMWARRMGHDSMIVSLTGPTRRSGAARKSVLGSLVKIGSHHPEAEHDAVAAVDGGATAPMAPTRAHGSGLEPPPVGRPSTPVLPDEKAPSIRRVNGVAAPYSFMLDQGWRDEAAAVGVDRAFLWDDDHAVVITCTPFTGQLTREQLVGILQGLAQNPGFAVGWTRVTCDNVEDRDIGGLIWLMASYSGVAPGDQRAEREQWVLLKEGFITEVAYVRPADHGANLAATASFHQAMRTFAMPTPRGE